MNFAGMRAKVHFSWAMHYLCNYRCPYCVFDGRWEELKGAHRDMPAVPELIKIWDGIYDRFGPCIVQTMGAEPTVLPGFDDLISKLSLRHYCFFTSNLWWPPERWKRLLDRADVSRMEIMGSFHPDMTPFEPFLKAALLLKENGVRVNVTLVAYPPNIPALKDYCLEFKLQGLMPNTQPFRGHYSGKVYPDAYTEAELDSIYALNEQMRAPVMDLLPYMFEQTTPKGKPCTAGQLYCHIGPNGDVYRCTMTQQPELKLGNLYRGFELSPEPRPCPADACPCESRWMLEERERAGLTGDDAQFASVVRS